MIGTRSGAGGAPLPQAAVDAGGMRKFRCLGKPAEGRIEGLRERLTRPRQRRFIENCAAHRQRRECAEGRLQLPALRRDLFAMVAIVLGHALENFAERGHSMAGLLGKISAAEEWLLVL